MSEPRESATADRVEPVRLEVAEGVATLIGPSTDPNGPEVDALVEYYRTVAGEHPDWDDYRRAMVADRRVLLRLAVERVYGQSNN